MKSEAKEASEALQRTFTKERGVNPESAYILDKDLEGIDLDGDGKISRKEARAAGLSTRRSARKAAANALKTLQPQMKDFQKLTGLEGEFYPEQTDDGGLKLYDESGNLQYTVITDEQGIQTGTKPDGKKAFERFSIDEENYTLYFDNEGRNQAEYIETQGVSGYKKRYVENNARVTEFTGANIKNDIVKETVYSKDGYMCTEHTNSAGDVVKYAKPNMPKIEDPKKEPEIPKAAPEPPKFNDVFRTHPKLTIDETGSTQKLTKDNTWQTDVKLPKNYDGNGLPGKIAIALPDQYGAEGPDGKAQKRYHTLTLIDADKNIYSDARGSRHFQMNVGEDGISLKQVSYNKGDVSELNKADSDKIKAHLDGDIKAVEKAALGKAQGKDGTSLGADKALSHENTTINIKSYEDAKDVIDCLKDRNLAWGAYTAIGTDNGSWTGDHGLIEYLLDTDFKDAQGNEYNLSFEKDLKPALQGLMARVPKEFQNDQDYIALNSYLTATDPASFKRNFDNRLISLAQKMKLQGTNFMPNQFLRGPAGNVMIIPDDDSSIWNTDAKFNLPTTGDSNKDFYFYRSDYIYDKCYDFQDIIGEGGLITNDATGNNRMGKINFDASKLKADERYYFQTKDGKEIFVSVEDGQAYITDANDNKILVNDILNGLVSMPYISE